MATPLRGEVMVPRNHFPPPGRRHVMTTPCFFLMLRQLTCRFACVNVHWPMPGRFQRAVDGSFCDRNVQPCGRRTNLPDTLHGVETA